MNGPDEAARAERLAAALRENLKRRKQQARGRQAPPDGPAPSSSQPVPSQPVPSSPAPSSPPPAPSPPSGGHEPAEGSATVQGPHPAPRGEGD